MGPDNSSISFSRGAYTARSLAGLIRKCGIVPRSHAGKIREIFEFYKDASTHPDSDEAQRRRMVLSPATVLKDSDRKWRLEHGADPSEVAAAKPLIVKYIGVWDPVGALGIPQHLSLSGLFKLGKKYQFHDTELSSTVRAARHAVAIDEDRLSFTPTKWSNIDTLNATTATGDKYQQIWFPGDHGSVGGGGEIRGLSNDALIWILEGAEAEGLALNKAAMAPYRGKVDPLASLKNQNKKPGRFERIYQRGDREGPQQKSLISNSAATRLAYEAKAADWLPYRPGTLKALWPK